jgi:hypothetical protein
VRRTLLYYKSLVPEPWNQVARTGDIIKILAQVLEALREGKKLAAREREKLHGNALLSLSAFAGEPNPDVLEEKVLLLLRTRYC